MIDLKNFLKNIAIKLSPGKHYTPEQGLCIMECVSYMEGKNHTDRPSCACDFLTFYAQYVNDHAPTDAARQELLPFVMRLAGSNRGDAMAFSRAKETMRVCFTIGSPRDDYHRERWCQSHHALAYSDWRMLTKMLLPMLSWPQQVALLDRLLKPTDCAEVEPTPERIERLQKAAEEHPLPA